jgi:hypothetical protein
MRLRTCARRSQKSSYQREQLGIVALDDYAAFVEQRQEVAPAATASALARNLGGMQRIDERLGFREREPRHRVEEVVQAVRARLYLPGLEEMDLVVGVGLSRRLEPNRTAACRSKAGFFRKRVEAIERALVPQALEPGTHRIERRMR